jgi:hypothetical protein
LFEDVDVEIGEKFAGRKLKLLPDGGEESSVLTANTLSSASLVR